MKNITLTSNEALVLIAEGMTMNNVKSLANKLRNADLPQPAVYPSVAAYEKTRKDNEDLSKECARHYENLEVAKQNLKLANQQVYDLERALEKAKQTETTLRAESRELTERTNRLESKLRDLENDARQDDESLKYFRQWVDTLRAALECDKGMTTAGVFSDAVSYVKEYKTTAELLKKTEGQLVKANDVIAAVKLAYDHEGWTLHKAICEISDTVEAYYRGN